MNFTQKRTVAIVSVIAATSLLSVVSPASAASPITSTQKQLIAFKIPDLRPEDFVPQPNLLLLTVFATIIT
jgi:hypothetical protein